jgi:hypothetical protein
LAKSQHCCGLYPQFCEVTNRHNRLHFWPLATPWVAHVTLGWSAGNGSAKSAKCPAWATALEAQRGDDKTGTILHIDHIVEDYMRLYMIMYFTYILIYIYGYIWIYMDIYIYIYEIVYEIIYIYIWDYRLYCILWDYRGSIKPLWSVIMEWQRVWTLLNWFNEATVWTFCWF